MSENRIKYIRIGENVFKLHKILSVKKKIDSSSYFFSEEKKLFSLEIMYCGKLSPRNEDPILQTPIRYYFLYPDEKTLDEKIKILKQLIKSVSDEVYVL
jgi:hypothetical protein